VALAALVVLVGVYLRATLRAARDGAPRPAPFSLAVVAAVAVALPLAVGTAWFGGTVFLAALLGLSLPARHALWCGRGLRGCSPALRSRCSWWPSGTTGFRAVRRGVPPAGIAHPSAMAVSSTGRTFPSSRMSVWSSSRRRPPPDTDVARLELGALIGCAVIVAVSGFAQWAGFAAATPWHAGSSTLLIGLAAVHATSRWWRTQRQRTRYPNSHQLHTLRH